MSDASQDLLVADLPQMLIGLIEGGVIPMP